MKFLLNIGNTHSEWCRQDLSGYQSIATLNLRSDFSVLDEMKQHDIFCASVVPELTRQLKDAGFKLAEIKADKLAVDFSQVDQSTLGADRIANVAAAYSLKELPAMVIDCGTAITTEIIDASAVFQGGAILPGRRLARQAMAHYTGQLPEIALEEVNSEANGKNTRMALAAGIDAACLGGIKELIARSEAQWPGLKLYVIGGDRAYFTTELGLKNGPDNFTLLGLQAASAEV